jgi:SAM-dependent methyltransferase
MDKPMSDSHFRLMSFGYKFRDLLVPRRSILEEADIKPGFHILDYGCGPGSYSLAAAELVGKSGKVYALDIHPLAIQMVRDKVSKRGLIPYVAPGSGITITDIYRSALPFIGIQAVCLVSIMLFPQVALFLPNMFFSS